MAIGVGMPESCGIVLTTSRVSRLLRPLRTKCKVFAASQSASSSTTGSRAKNGSLTTYATSSRSDSVMTTENNTPLAVVPPPQKLRALSHLDRATRAQIALSKKVHDVRDAFRNVLQAVVVESSTAARSSSAGNETGSVPGLAVICAAFIGTRIEEQIAENREEREAVEFAEREDMETLNEYYEAVPGHYRQ